MNSHTPLHRAKGRRLWLAAGLAALTVSAVDVATGSAAARPLPTSSVAVAHAVAARPTVAPAAAPVRVAAAPRPALAPTTVAVGLCATTGTATLHDADGTAVSVPVWGYSDWDGTTCAPLTPFAAPVISANPGDTLRITLHNNLTSITSLSVTGQSMPSDMVGVAPSGTKTYPDITVAGGATGSSTFTYHPGSAGPAEVQTAMGLVGVLKVGAPEANDAVVLISEVDKALNTSADPTTFDMRHFQASWILFNGSDKAADLASVPQGQPLRLRYVNAGITYHSVSLLGGSQTIVADDGHPLTHPYNVTAQTIGPGQSTDVDITTNLAAPASTMTVFDGTLLAHNPQGNGTSAAYGGSVGFIQVTGNSTSVPAPITTNVTLTTGGDVSATVASALPVLEVRAFVDAVNSAPFTLNPVVNVTNGWSGNVPLPTDPSKHSATVFVQGRDSNGWGPVSAATVQLDREAPAVTGLTVTPAITNGNTVVLKGVASDAGHGDSNVVSFDYSVSVNGIDGPWTHQAIASPAPDVEVNASVDITSAPEGTVTIKVRATDSANPANTTALANYGSVTLIKDITGPAVGVVSVSPNPTNGKIGVNSSTPAVRVTTTITDARTKIVAARAFINNGGTGIVMVPTDGTWNSTVEGARLDIPLTTIRGLVDGTFNIKVQGKDAAGNWTTVAVASPPVLLDTKAPNISIASVVVNAGSQTVSTTVGALDPAPSSGINSTTWSIDGGATSSAAAVSVSTKTMTEGTHTLTVTSTDNAGNTATKSVNFTVTRNLYFSGTGNTTRNNVFFRTGTTTSTFIPGTTAGIPTSANVDGLARVGANAFYASFQDNVTLPGVGLVQDEDIVYWNGSSWSMAFVGAAHGLTTNDLDLQEFDVVGHTNVNPTILPGELYFATFGNSNPPGLGGTADDSDVYRWNPNSTYTRVFDASTRNVATTNKLDGLSVVDGTHMYFSFTANGTFRGVAAVSQDILYFNNGAWSNWFAGHNINMDAIDVP